MPVRNGGAFIGRGLESLLGQTYGDLELVISDNGSTDATGTICEEYARRDARVIYQRLDANLGLHANFARLIDEARGPYFMWACHDDWWDPAYVERMVAVLDAQPSVVLAGSNATSIDQFDIRHQVFDNVRVYGQPGPTANRVRRFLAEPPGNGHATLMYGLMRTPAIQRVGYAPPGPIRDADRGYYAMDLLLLLRLILEGEFHVDPDILYARRDVLWSQQQWIDHDRSWREQDRLAAAIRAARAAHGFYADCRRILRSSDLAADQRRALVRTTYREEARFHPRAVGRLAGTTRRRLARRVARGSA
jgi:glycosyltransferase involved in cell wall biosynthesis